MAKTRMSSKGQVVIPKAVRERHGWSAGVEVDVEDHGDSVVLRGAGRFAPTRFEDVYGCLRHNGPPITLAAMEEAVRREARRHR
jgi:AbrB family looped-hinge helix DNA binding protein